MSFKILIYAETMTNFVCLWWV